MIQYVPHAVRLNFDRCRWARSDAGRLWAACPSRAQRAGVGQMEEQEQEREREGQGSVSGAVVTMRVSNDSGNKYKAARQVGECTEMMRRS